MAIIKARNPFDSRIIAVRVARKPPSFAIHGFQRPFRSGINRFAQSDLRGIKEQPCAPSHDPSRYAATCSWLVSEDNDLNPRTIRNLIHGRRFFGQGVASVDGGWLVYDVVAMGITLERGRLDYAGFS